MSGHSKWSTIRHKKAANDSVRGSVFTKMAKAITIAVKQGGGVSDPDQNFTLRLAIDKARSVNMPKENIDRAIAKGMGKGGDEVCELVIEVFAPGGILAIFELVSDSRNRSVAEMRTLIDKHGGRMGDPGSVMHSFERCGIVKVSPPIDESIELKLIDLGMQDSITQEGSSILYTTVEGMQGIVLWLKSVGANPVAGVGYRPKVLLESSDPAKTEAFLEIMAEYEDVGEIYANMG